MKRLGKFTGKIYNESDFENGGIYECATLISDEQANDENFIQEHHLVDLTACLNCFNCPASQSSIVN